MTRGYRSASHRSSSGSCHSLHSLRGSSHSSRDWPLWSYSPLIIVSLVGEQGRASASALPIYNVSETHRGQRIRQRRTPTERMVLYGRGELLCSHLIRPTEGGFSITEAQANHLHGCISTQTKVLKFCPSCPFPPSARLPYRGISH